MFWNVNLSQILKSRIKVNVNVNVIVYENHIRNSHRDNIAKQARKHSEQKSNKCENIKHHATITKIVKRNLKIAKHKTHGEIMNKYKNCKTSRTNRETNNNDFKLKC